MSEPGRKRPEVESGENGAVMFQGVEDSGAMTDDDLIAVIKVLTGVSVQAAVRCPPSRPRQ